MPPFALCTSYRTLSSGELRRGRSNGPDYAHPKGLFRHPFSPPLLLRPAGSNVIVHLTPTLRSKAVDDATLKEADETAAIALTYLRLLLRVKNRLYSILSLPRPFTFYRLPMGATIVIGGRPSTTDIAATRSRTVECG